MKNKMLGFYNYTVWLTYIGMLIGFLGIICAMEGDVYTGMICLMCAGVCDMFDGAVAATKERTEDEKCFGIQIDSLSDLICFGVLPALLVYRLNQTEIAYAIVALYVLCALIRLSYFNVDEQNRQKVSTGGREYYLGLPVTTMAIILPLFMEIERFIPLKKGTLGLVVIAVVGILFLTPFQLKKPKMIGKVAMGLFGIVEFAFLVMGMGDV